MGNKLLKTIHYKCEFCNKRIAKYVYTRESPGDKWLFFVLCQSCLIKNTLLGIPNEYQKIIAYSRLVGKGEEYHLYSPKKKIYRTIRVDDPELTETLHRYAKKYQDEFINASRNSI